MGELAVRHLPAQGTGSLTITNRTEERAQVLADTFGCGTLPLSRLRDEADQFDIVITSTGSQEVLFSRDDARQIMAQRRRRPMFVIDVAVPRDIDPEANNVEGFFLYDIDDLQSVAAANLADRARGGQSRGSRWSGGRAACSQFIRTRPGSYDKGASGIRRTVMSARMRVFLQVIKRKTTHAATCKLGAPGRIGATAIVGFRFMRDLLEC